MICSAAQRLKFSSPALPHGSSNKLIFKKIGKTCHFGQKRIFSHDTGLILLFYID